MPVRNLTQMWNQASNIFISSLAVLLLPVYHLQNWKESQRMNIISFCQRFTHLLIFHRNKLPPLLEIYQRGWYWSIIVNANQRVHQINKRHYRNAWDSEINIYSESIPTGEALGNKWIQEMKVKYMGMKSKEWKMTVEWNKI